jgi:hypothetical protein
MTNSRRRQRAEMSSVPGRMYDTSPRGLPIINDNSGGGFPALGGDDRGYGAGQNGYDEGDYNGGQQSRPEDADLPWNNSNSNARGNQGYESETRGRRR